MADTDVLPSRGVPRMALVDSTGVATNGSSTIAQLAAKGIQSICAVDATGVSVGGPNVAQLASAGIRSFCPVDENGVAQDSSTAIQLQTRGIRPMVLLGNTGIALTGSSDMPTLARKGLGYFCPVDESGNATTMGPVVLLSNATVQDNATVGSLVGTLSVAGGSGTYNFTLTSNPGSHFVLAGTNGVNLNTATALTVGTYPITVQAAGGVPTPVTRTFAITVIPSPVAPANTVLPVISGSTVVGNVLTTTSGTWTGFPAPTFTYQWQRAAGVDAATTAWVSAVTGLLGTVSGTQQTRVDTLIKALKSGPTTGTNYFTILDRLWLFAGESSDPQSRTDIITATTPMTNHGAVLSANGYTGDAVSKYLDTGFKPSTAGGHFVRDDASVIVWAKTAADTNHALVGAIDTTGGVYILVNINNGFDLNDGSFPGGSLTVPGRYIVSRTSSAGFQIYKDGATFGAFENATSSGVGNNNVFVLANSNNTGAAAGFCSDTVSVVGLGKGLTAAQATELTTILNGYIGAWGVTIP